LFPHFITVPPDVQVSADRIIQSRGRKTAFDCTIKAFPLKTKSWIFNNREVAKPVWKYKSETFQRDERTTLYTLEIIDLEDGDFGEYRCFAKNELGEASAIVVLEGL